MSKDSTDMLDGMTTTSGERVKRAYAELAEELELFLDEKNIAVDSEQLFGFAQILVTPSLSSTELAQTEFSADDQARALAVADNWKDRCIRSIRPRYNTLTASMTPEQKTMFIEKLDEVVVSHELGQSVQAQYRLSEADLERLNALDYRTIKKPNNSAVGSPLHPGAQRGLRHLVESAYLASSDSKFKELFTEELKSTPGRYKDFLLYQANIPSPEIVGQIENTYRTIIDHIKGRGATARAASEALNQDFPYVNESERKAARRLTETVGRTIRYKMKDGPAIKVNFHKACLYHNQKLFCTLPKEVQNGITKYPEAPLRIEHIEEIEPQLREVIGRKRSEQWLREKCGGQKLDALTVDQKKQIDGLLPQIVERDISALKEYAHEVYGGNEIAKNIKTFSSEEIIAEEHSRRGTTRAREETEMVSSLKRAQKSIAPEGAVHAAKKSRVRGLGRE